MTAIQNTFFDYAELDAETRIVVQQRTSEIKALMKRAAADIIEIGQKLIEVKDRLGHGTYLMWLDAENIERTLAWRCCRVAEAFPDPQMLHGATFHTKALYLLAAPSTPEGARQEAVARAEEGETITYSAARGIVADHKEPALPFGSDEEPSDDPLWWDRENAPIDTRPQQVITDQPTSTMKPKINRAGDMYVPQGFDACQTPPYAIDPLLPYLPMEWTIWEPACGEGMLVEAFYDASRNVVSSDILTGANFFETEPDQWDCLVTNPPYSIKYQWLARCYELGKPFALLLPVETLGAKAAQALFVQYGVRIILLDKRINFKMPNIGWDGSSAQFPVAWFTCGLNLETQIVFGRLNETR